jgi:hypothetical protein
MQKRCCTIISGIGALGFAEATAGKKFSHEDEQEEGGAPRGR